MRNQNQKIKIIPDLDTVEIRDLIHNHKCDYIFSYKENGKAPKTFAISRKRIKQAIKVHKDLTYINDLITFYLNLDSPVTILKVYKHPHTFYQRCDFSVKVLATRTYRPYFDDPFTLQCVRITNLRNREVFEDFIFPHQLEDIPNLIEWDIEGEILNL